MITSFLDPGRASELTPCKFASVGGSEDCCADPSSPWCSRADFPPFVEKNFSVQIHQARWPTWGKVKTELGGDRPFGVIENYPQTGGAHMYVATGAHEVDNSTVLKVYDPAGQGDFWWHEYDQFTTEEPDREMGFAYYEIRGDSTPQCLTDDAPPDACHPKTGGAGSILTGCHRPPVPTGTPVPSNGSQLAATTGLARVRLIGAADPSSLGFRSAQQAKDEPLRTEVYYLHDVELDATLNQCMALSTQAAVSDGYVYVSTKTDKGLGFIEVVKRGTTWHPSQYGGNKDAEAIHQQAALLRKQNPLFPARPLLLRVRPLRLFLLVEPQPAAKPRFYPSRDLGDFKKGVPVPESTVVDQIRRAVPRDLYEGQPF